MTSQPPITLVTGNRGKVAEAARIVGFELQLEDLDLPEIQSLDLLEVLAAKGEEAWQRLQRPLVVEETGLDLAAFNGFPGPLIKWMLQALGAAGIARSAAALDEFGATAHCALLYRDEQRTLIGRGETAGRLLAVPRGSGGFGWDSIFVPSGHEQSFAELAPATKDRVGHRGKAWRAMVGELQAAGLLAA